MDAQHSGERTRGAASARRSRSGGVKFLFAAEAVERLTCRIISGEAVFLVGAGFSVDSEPNTAARLIRRLMARFTAITEHLIAHSPSTVATELCEGLRVTFALDKEALAKEPLVSDKVIDVLKQVYNNINDWVCNAYTMLLGELSNATPVRDLITSTRFLHATGLNLLTYSQDAKVDAYEVERAFAWLLPMTRQRL